MQRGFGECLGCARDRIEVGNESPTYGPSPLPPLPCQARVGGGTALLALESFLSNGLLLHFSVEIARVDLPDALLDNLCEFGIVRKWQAEDCQWPVFCNFEIVSTRNTK